MKRVSFSEIDVILYYKQTKNKNNDDDWMQHARDRIRFQRRVKQIEKILLKVLKVGENAHI
jgi:hypothetical protein